MLGIWRTGVSGSSALMQRCDALGLACPTIHVSLIISPFRGSLSAIFCSQNFCEAGCWAGGKGCFFWCIGDEQGWFNFLW